LARLPISENRTVPRPPLIVASLLVAASVALQGQWPQFRGPDGMGTSNSNALPLTWSEEKNVRWRSEVHGRGWSSPVILDNQVWVTTASEDGQERFAVALDQATGKIVHDIKVFTVPQPPEIHPFNSFASPTPVVEKGRVYVNYGSVGTAAIDTVTGTIVWQRRDLKCDHFRGPGSSPILFRNLLLMHFDGIDLQYVVALDKETGKTVWQTPRSIDFKDLEANGKPKGDGDFRKAFATPHIITVGGEPLLISLGGKAAYAYDPLTGKERWRVEERASHTASSRPVAGLGMVFYATGWENSQILAVRPDGRGDLTSTHVVWRYARGVPNKPSLLLVDDLIFMVNDTGIVTALEARTGQAVWQHRVSGMFSASPLYAAGRVYLFDEDGKTTVIQAAREFKVLAENLLDNGFMASAAAAGNALFLRTTKDVYRIEETQ
jgi:outer membrane protein assembly factor BamB